MGDGLIFDIAIPPVSGRCDFHGGTLEPTSARPSCLCAMVQLGRVVRLIWAWSRW